MSHGMAHSAIFRRAVELRKQCREEYEGYLYTQYLKADKDCRGRLLNREGERRGIDSLSLFLGNEQRAQKYASEELRNWWAERPMHMRTTFEAWEESWVETHE